MRAMIASGNKMLSLEEWGERKGGSCALPTYPYGRAPLDHGAWKAIQLVSEAQVTCCTPARLAGRQQVLRHLVSHLRIHVYTEQSTLWRAECV
jgi:hypothetical protein